jgi:hypothetical protein
MLEVNDIEKIVFLNSFDLDHILTGYEIETDNVEDIYNDALNNLKFEISISHSNEIDKLINYKFKIPKHNYLDEIKEEYNSFREMVLFILNYKNNEDVFPYFEDN